MPTIDDLPNAVSVSDLDEMALSQNSVTRKATRSQLLSGVQTALALPPNSLLGRVSSGIGSPESVAIGANLSLTNGTLSAPSSYNVGSLPMALPPSAEDLVPLGQEGKNVVTDFRTFMGGLSAIAGIDGSNLVVRSKNAPNSRTLAALTSDFLSIESFGAVGDGMADDTVAFQAAIQSGQPIRLSSAIYIVNGPVYAACSIWWFGVAGGTVIRRAHVSAQQVWIELAGHDVHIDGVDFDQAQLAQSQSPCIQVDTQCLNSVFDRCRFRNAGLGSGLRLLAGTNSCHKIQNCWFSANDLHGADISGTGQVTFVSSVFDSNGGNGVNVAPETAISLAYGTFSQNTTGICVGAWNESAPAAGTSSLCVVTNNICFNNRTWGIAVGGFAALVQANTLSGNGLHNVGGGGVLARLGASKVSENVISASYSAIDARSSWGSQFCDNHITGSVCGFRLGGCSNIAVKNNFIMTNQWGVDVTAIEPTLSFTPTGAVSLCENWIGFTSALGGGVFVHDGCSNIAVVDNDFNGWGSATESQALWLHTDRAIVSRNRWNNVTRDEIEGISVSGLSTLVLPDVSDGGLVLSAESPVQSILSSHQLDTIGQIGFIRVTAGGAGYTGAQVSIHGAGTGATASAVVNNGQVVWITVSNPGSGYGALGASASVNVSGDGDGATATAYVGLPVLDGRKLSLSCNCPVSFGAQGSTPAQENWTGYAASVPALGSLKLEGAFGAWRLSSFDSSDYLLPTGDGGMLLQSVGGGDVKLRPSSGGAIHISDANELVGYTCSVGRGSPMGVVSAPPGSEFRNLDGGAGNTMWVKQTGNDANGWVAIA